jgi:cholesterol oxidase
MRLSASRLGPGLLRRPLRRRRGVADPNVPRALEVAPRRRPGLRFTERMIGHLCPPDSGADRPCPHQITDDDRLTLTLTIVIDDVADLLARPSHPATLVGTAECRQLSRDGPLVLTGGTFHLLRVDPSRVERRLIDYAGTLTALDGQDFTFTGFKDLYNHARVSDLWSDTSTLHLAVNRRPGVAWLSAGDFARQLTTFKVTNAASRVEGLDVLWDFVRFFAGVLRDLYGRLLARGHLITVDAPPPAPRPRSWPEPYSAPVTTTDGVRLSLERYRGGPRGPVLLAPGFGMTSRCFVTDTIPVNLVEHLCARQYDVWLLDYRSSPNLGVAGTAYTIDDIAVRDWPAAVDAVIAATGVPQIQVFAHCVGALSLLMGMVAGGLTGKVRFAICSQLGLHPISNGGNHVKVGLPIAWALRAVGWEAISAHYEERSWWDWFLDKGLRLWPTGERCNNPVCRRVLFLFGESYKHDRLTTVTHDAMGKLFGWTSLRALQHLALMLRKRQALDRHGEDVYCGRSQLEKLADIPIAFMHGTGNRQFLPESSQETLKALREANPRGRYVLKEFEGFGHLDCLVGRDADQIFNWIADQLDDHPR